jgi:hypothetical protein
MATKCKARKRNERLFKGEEVNTLDTEPREYLLDKLRIMATLQQWLWDGATTIADDLLDCELDAVLKQIPEAQHNWRIGPR